MCGLSTVVTPAGASLTMYREIRSYANSIWDDNNNNNNNRHTDIQTYRHTTDIQTYIHTHIRTVTAGKCNWRHSGWSARLVGFPQCYLACRFLTNKIFILFKVRVVFQNEKEEG